MRRLGTALAVALAMCAMATARQSGARATDPRADSFICGQDQSLPPISATWPAVVLAGDGRLYSPCPEGNHGPEHRENREAGMIIEGRYSDNATLRWRAAQATARNAAKRLWIPLLGAGPSGGSPLEVALAQVDGLGGFVLLSTVQPACSREVQVISVDRNVLRWQPGRLFMMLGELNNTATRAQGNAPPNYDSYLNRQQVVKEGAYGIGTQLTRADLDPNVVTAATRELRVCFAMFGVGDIAALILEDLGLARYANENDVQDAEIFLTQESTGPPVKVLGALKGLEALIRQNPRHQISDLTRSRLRELVLFGDRRKPPPPFDTVARIRGLALRTLLAAHDVDLPTLRDAAADPDWQVRRLVAAVVNLSDPEMSVIGDSLAPDLAFQVRYEMLTPLARRASRTGDCAAVVERFQDPSPIVQMRAMDLLPASCQDLDEATKTLVSFANRLVASSTDKFWNVPARALTALARVKPAEVRSRISAAARHNVWQVRATVAALTIQLRDSETARTLARDPNANVRTAALDALFRMRSADVVPEAILALQNGTDYGLLRMAATALTGVPEDSRNAASEALLTALRRLTDQASDTSRDPRLAIVERLGETLSPMRFADLQPFATDLDDEVSAAVVTVYTKLVNVPPSVSKPPRRYPYQPPAASFAPLPTQATIQLDSGFVELRLLTDVAPVTVARFAELVRGRYYNGTSFHRVVPNFVVQGGSPGDNDFMGVPRFLRDEVGPQASHLRGVVGMSSRGRDMGDGQIFIDLVDQPRFDRDYTVFANVVRGMDLVDTLLEGAKIVAISMR